MADIYYPRVSLDFIIACVEESGKLQEEDGIIKVRNSVIFIMKGTQNILKRTTHVRAIENEIVLEMASALALRYGFMGKLLSWLENNKKWKDGEYIV